MKGLFAVLAVAFLIVIVGIIEYCHGSKPNLTDGAED
jgi:Flp pilus assembly protein TadG